MATLMSRDQHVAEKVFPVEVLRGHLKMIIAGLYSTQSRIRLSTYRFLLNTNALGGARWLVEKDAVDLLTAMEDCRENAEADTFDEQEAEVQQVYDYGMIMLNYVIQPARFHPCTLKPVIQKDQPGIKWVWHRRGGKECSLGDEGMNDIAEESYLDTFLEERVRYLR